MKSHTEILIQLDETHAHVEDLFKEKIRDNDLQLPDAIETFQKIYDDLADHSDAANIIPHRLQPNADEFTFEEFKELTHFAYTEPAHTKMMYDIIVQLGEEREMADDRQHIFTDIFRVLINMGDKLHNAPITYEQEVFNPPPEESDVALLPNLDL